MGAAANRSKGSRASWRLPGTEALERNATTRTGEQKMDVETIVKYVFTAIGVGLLTGAFLLYKTTSSFLGEANTAEGTVVDVVQSRSGDSTNYRPVVRFTHQNGEKIEFISSSGSNPPSYSKGEKVPVSYDPAEPQTARINDFFSLWGGPTILGVVGGAFFLVGAGLILAGALKGPGDEKLKKHRAAMEADFQNAVQAMREGNVTKSTRYVIHGKEYHSLSDIPESERKELDAHFKLFEDKDKDGTPDIFQKNDARGSYAESKEIRVSTLAENSEKSVDLLKRAMRDVGVGSFGIENQGREHEARAGDSPLINRHQDERRKEKIRGYIVIFAVIAVIAFLVLKWS